MDATPGRAATRAPAVIAVVAEAMTVLLVLLLLAFPGLGAPDRAIYRLNIPQQISLALTAAGIALTCGFVVMCVGIIEGIRSRRWQWPLFFLLLGTLSLQGPILIALQLQDSARMPLTPDQDWGVIIVSALALFILAVGGIAYARPTPASRSSGASA